MGNVLQSIVTGIFCCSHVHQSFSHMGPYHRPILWVPDQPLVLRLDLEDLHCPLLPSVQSFGFLAAPLRLVLLGPSVSQYHSLVTQHVLQIMSRVLLDAVSQECLGEHLRFRVGLRLEKRQ